YLRAVPAAVSEIAAGLLAGQRQLHYVGVPAGRSVGRIHRRDSGRPLRRTPHYYLLDDLLGALPFAVRLHYRLDLSRRAYSRRSYPAVYDPGEPGDGS